MSANVNSRAQGSPILASLFAYGCFWLATRLWKLGQYGEDSALMWSVLLFVLGLAAAASAFTALESRIFQRRAERSTRHVSGIHGDSRWAKLREVKRAGMLSGRGLFLGSLQGKPIYYPGETHLLTIAPPGAGKGTSIVIPNLLRYPGSVVVADPKAELYAVTARHRARKLGNRVIVLCPWADKMSEELGIEIPDHGFNPLSILQPGPDLKDEAELLSTLLLPGKAGMNASDEFWLDGGQTILTAFLLDLVSRYETYDLPLLRRQLLAPPNELSDSLLEMSRNEDFGGCIAEYGGKLLGALQNAPQQFEGWMGSAQKALRIYDPFSPMAAHVGQGEIDFKSLKNEPTTIYLILPTDRANSHAAWLNLVLSLAMELVGRDRSNRRVLFLLDEMANLGYLPNVLRGMAQYRGQGVQIWSIIQQVSQLERLYRREGMREILGMSEAVNTFGIWEPDTLKVVSDWLGQRSVKGFSQSVTPESGGVPFGYNYSATEVASPLLRPEEIRTLPSDQQLIFYRNQPPILAEKRNYLKDRRWRRLAGPNPYHRHSH